MARYTLDSFNELMGDATQSDNPMSTGLSELRSLLSEDDHATFIGDFTAEGLFATGGDPVQLVEGSIAYGIGLARRLDSDGFSI